MPSAAQTYDTHRHNPRPTAIAGLLALIALVCFVLTWLSIASLMAIGLLALWASVFVLVAISRIYTTTLQDRIIKLEMRVRCDRVLTPAQRINVDRLSKPQLVALRFASDEELPELIERALRENMTADQIKRAVKQWTPDYDRT